MRAWALTFLLPCLPCLPPTSAGVTDEIMLPKSQEKAVQLPGAIKLTCYGRMGLTPHARAAEGQTGQAEATQNGRLSGRSGESVCLGPESSPLGSLGGQRRASLWIQSSQTGMSFSELPKEGSGLQGSGSQLAHKGSPGVGWGVPAGGAGPSPSSETLVLRAPENPLGQYLALRRSERKASGGWIRLVFGREYIPWKRKVFLLVWPGVSHFI